MNDATAMQNIVQRCITCSADCLLKGSSYFHGHVTAIFSESVILIITLAFGIKNNGKRIKYSFKGYSNCILFAKFELKLPPLS